MGGGVKSPVQFSPNYKIVEVGRRLGIKDLSQMQITTRQIYHAIKLNATTTTSTIQFFVNVNTTAFPYTNLTDNKLQAGEALAVERAYLSILNVDPANPQYVKDVYPCEFVPGSRAFLRGDFDLQIDRQTVTKKVNTTSWFAPFNKDAQFGNFQFDVAGGLLYEYGQSVYHFDNSFIIPPQIEFSCTLTVPAIQMPVGEWYIMLNLEGLGCLFNPKANY